MARTALGPTPFPNTSSKLFPAPPQYAGPLAAAHLESKAGPTSITRAGRDERRRRSDKSSTWAVGAVGSAAPIRK